jgi:lipopolysaccharide transport system ATP-binding protein
MRSKEVLLSLRDVSVSYSLRSGFFKWIRSFPLQDVSFDLHRGETVGILGRNGAGKSTLLRLIAGIIEPDKGKVVVNEGVRISLLSLGVGFVPHLSGRENAILNGILLGLRLSEIKARMDAIIEFSGLGEQIDRPLRTYSSGMRARLGFTVAIQTDPDILLIDEIFGVGDEDFRMKSNAEIKRLLRSDKTVVLVSHQLPAIKELCDRVVWIEDGGIRDSGDTNSVVGRYVQGMRATA